MFKRNWVVLFAAAAVSMAASVGYTAAFSYRAEVPTDGRACDSHAKAVALLFQKSSGVNVTSYACMSQNTFLEGKNSYSRDIIRVDYVSDRQLLPTKSVFGGQEFLGTIFEHSGYFRSYSDCLAQVAGQTASFEAQTGLSAVVAYCDNSGGTTAPSYSLIIEGFGVPKGKLYLFVDSSIYSGYKTSGSALSQIEQKVVTAGGGQIVFSDSTHIFYYAPRHVAITTSNLGYYKTPAQCAEQVPSAQAVYNNAGVTAAVAFCVENRLTVVAPYTMAVQEYSANSSPMYSSYSDCMADKTRLLNNFISQGVRPLGAICTPSMQTFDQFIVLAFGKG